MKKMDSFWMPFTSNRAFKEKPRLVEKAEGMYYYKPDGSKVLDMVAGLEAQLHEANEKSKELRSASCAHAHARTHTRCQQTPEQ